MQSLRFEEVLIVEVISWLKFGTLHVFFNRPSVLSKNLLAEIDFCTYMVVLDALTQLDID